MTSASGVGWAVLGMLAGVNGMIVLTLSVSFVLSTTQTVARGRAFLMKVDSADLQETSTRQSLLFDLAEVVAMLNASPFALYYSAVEPDRRLPSGLAHLARQWELDQASKLHPMMRELPWLHLQEGQPMHQSLQSWSRRFCV